MQMHFRTQRSSLRRKKNHRSSLQLAFTRWDYFHMGEELHVTTHRLTRTLSISESDGDISCSKRWICTIITPIITSRSLHSLPIFALEKFLLLRRMLVYSSNSFTA